MGANEDPHTCEPAHVGNNLIVRRTLDYRIATGMTGLLYCVALLVPPFGGPQKAFLAIFGIFISSLALYRPLSERLRFSETGVEFVSILGSSMGSWPLDGNSWVSFDPVVTQSRWGRAVRGSLMIKGRSGMALALTRGRYTKQAQWSEFLLDQERLGRILISDEARQHLRGNVTHGM